MPITFVQIVDAMTPVWEQQVRHTLVDHQRMMEWFSVRAPVVHHVYLGRISSEEMLSHNGSVYRVPGLGPEQLVFNFEDPR